MHYEWCDANHIHVLHAHRGWPTHRLDYPMQWPRADRLGLLGFRCRALESEQKAFSMAALADNLYHSICGNWNLVPARLP